MTADFADKVKTRLTKLPSPLAKSELYLSSNRPILKSPSSVLENSRRRK
ncbi:MAG: hypothetical protein ABIJ60_01430 [Patescibacteria group bacterium]